MPNQSYIDGAKFMADIALNAAPKAKKLAPAVELALQGLVESLESGEIEAVDTVEPVEIELETEFEMRNRLRVENEEYREFYP